MTFPTTEPCVAAAERELGVKLPREFRERLIARNGGELSTAGEDWDVFPVLDTTNPKTGSSIGHIVTVTHQARGMEGFPPQAVAIGSNGRGDYLVLLPSATAGRLDPQVQVWNHESRRCKPAALRYDD